MSLPEQEPDASRPLPPERRDAQARHSAQAVLRAVAEFDAALRRITDAAEAAGTDAAEAVTAAVAAATRELDAGRVRALTRDLAALARLFGVEPSGAPRPPVPPRFRSGKRD